MSKGVTYKLTLHNTASSPTNLHTHGLHIVGDGDGDDITRVVQGGNTCLDYTWDIPADHPGGTHWYHPHYHGKTNEQVAGGAFGMIIVEDDDEELSDWASNMENERLLMVLLNNSGGSSGNGRWDRNLQLVARHHDERYLPDSWYRLRTLIVTPDAEPNTLSFGSGCTVYKVASDGVWHSADLTTYEGSSFVLTGASRADFAVRCSAGSHVVSWGGTNIANIDARSEHGYIGGIVRVETMRMIWVTPRPDRRRWAISAPRRYPVPIDSWSVRRRIRSDSTGPSIPE